MARMEMTPKERLLAALQGKQVDRIPWSPFLVWWWENQNQIIRDLGQPAFLSHLGADTLLRGFSTVCKSSHIYAIMHTDAYDYSLPFDDDRCEFRRQKRADEIVYEWVTPVGSLRMISKYSYRAIVDLPIEYPVKTKEDYKILTYLVENMQLAPNYEPNEQAIRVLGDNGLYVPVVTPFLKTPFQALVEHYVGVMNLSYHMVDFPEETEALLAIMNEKAAQSVRMAAESPAEAFITWEDSSTTNLSPAWYAQYVAPVIYEWGRILHTAGKLLLHHACGHLRALLPIMAQGGADAIESVTPPTLGNVHIWEAQEILGDQVGIIGGIEGAFFQDSSLEELRGYLTDVLLPRVNPRRFILANADSCPPGVSFEKFRLVSDIVKNWRLA
jgi:uroporphyrinogen-III decarboxylase